MKLVITAGGGGHFAPALSVIKQLPKGTEILVIGRKYAFEGDKTIALEYRTAEALKIPFKALTTARLQRSFTRHTIPSIGKLPVGFYQAYKILREFKPDIVLSFGGYVAVPVTLAASTLHIPVVIHEQTLGGGMANKIASRFAEKICLSFEDSLKYFPKAKSVVTGNPLREEVLQASEKDSPLPEKTSTSLPLLYVTGGSLGSHALNLLVEETLEELVKSYTVFHQTGDAQEFKDFDRLQEKRHALPKEVRDRYILTKFVNPASVGALMKTADLVISRAGMNTVSELIYLNVPALLIPLPHGQNKEQLLNAQFLEKLGLGVVLEQETATPEKFVETIASLMKDIKSYSIPLAKRKELIHEDASARIIRILLDVYEKNHQTKTTKTGNQTAK